MKEYYTNVITHDHLHPSDLSGSGLTPRRNDYSSTRERSNHSPIRLNDTYRSNITLGEDDNGTLNRSYSSRILNTTVD
jgi:hypothetical protein